MKFILEVISTLIVVATILVVIALLMGYPTMWMMNYLFTPAVLQTVFGISQMTFWKAFWFDVFAGGLVMGSSSSSRKS